MLYSSDQKVIFDNLSEATKKLVEENFESFACPVGAVIFEQGDPAEFLYLLLQGSVSARYKPYDGPKINLTTIHAGGAFGWSAAIGGPHYTLDAVALENLQTIRIRRAALRALVNEHPAEGAELLDRLAQLVSNRWKDANRQVRAILEQAVPHDHGKEVK